jgi:hypothetical protein
VARGTAAEEVGEVLDGADTALLSLRRQLTDRPVFDHAPAQGTVGLVRHGGALVCCEVASPHLQTGRPHPVTMLRRAAAAAPYRASGLVQWRYLDLP